MKIRDQESFTRSIIGVCDFFVSAAAPYQWLSLKPTDAVGATYENSSFVMMAFRDHNITCLEDDDGNKKYFVCNELYYILPETTWLYKTPGFNKICIFGARLGEFSREHTLTTEDFEMPVVAEKCWQELPMFKFPIIREQFRLKWFAGWCRVYYLVFEIISMYVAC